MKAKERPLRAAAARALALAVALASAAAGVSGGGADKAEAQRSRPNIVLVVTDDQRLDTMWAMPSVRRRIGDRGVTFNNSYVVNSLCCPSRASSLTGLYAHTTGVWTNRSPTGGFGAFNDESTIPVWLKEVGYRTGFVGKYLNGYNRNQLEYIPPGWDRWVAFGGTRRRTVYYHYRLSVNGVKRYQGGKPKNYSTDVYADYAARFVRNSKAPFFLMLAPNAPHKPATPADRHKHTLTSFRSSKSPSFDEEDVSDKPLWLQKISRLSPEKRKELRKLRRNQLRSLLAVDEAVHRILSILADQNELRRTVVIFTSDNGFLLGEHRWKLKQVSYEEAIRVPLLIRAPDITSQGGSSEAFALNVDLAPTIADYANAPHPETEGTSLRPLLTNPEDEIRSSFLFEHLQEPTGGNPPTYCGIRNKNYSYTAYVTGEEELYDMNADPYQLENVAGSPAYTHVLANLRAEMVEKCNPPPPGFDPTAID